MSELDRYLQAATRDNTRRSYRAAIEHFEVQWGGFLPATAEGVARYLVAYAGELSCGFHTIRPPSPLSSGQAFHGHLATCSTAIRPGSRSAATQGWHC